MNISNGEVKQVKTPELSQKGNEKEKKTDSLAIEKQKSNSPG